MKQEINRQTITTKNGLDIELNPGGIILTNMLIFDRADLLEKCPPAVQTAIKLYHAGIDLVSHGQHNRGRLLIEEAIESISSQSDSGSSK